MAVAGRGTMDVHETSDEIRGQCDMCEDEMYNGYCAECEINMCNPCFNLHLKSKKCRHHVLQEGSSIDSKTKSAQYKFCYEHGQVIKLYCTSHEVFGCGECMVFEHKDCKIEYLAEACKSFKENGELDSVLEEIKTLTKTNEEHKKVIDSLDDKIIAMDEIAVNKIESSARSAVEAIEAAKMFAIEGTQLRTNKNKETIATNKCKLETVSSQLSELTNNFAISKQPHEVFMLAVESKSTIAAIRDTLNGFDSQHIISEFEFESSKNLEKLLAGQRPLGRFTDDETEQDFEQEYKVACERIEILQEENKRLDADLKSNISKLETLEQDKKKEFGLPCSHIGRIEQLTEQRTIKCSMCNIVFGDQPVGEMKTIVKTHEKSDWTYHEMTFVFPAGTQSKMNRNPGRQYSGSTQSGYLRNDAESDSVLSMMKTAFDRNLLFTIDESGSIVNGVVKVFKYNPWRTRIELDELKPSYVEYIKRVKQQLADVGINQ